MTVRSSVFTFSALLICLSTLPSSASEEETKALAVLQRVVGHTQRLITAKNFERLPHENGEFKEGNDALQQAISSEPPPFKSKVGPLLKSAEEASQNLADAAASQDLTKLNPLHKQFADAVERVIAAFPETTRPAR